MIVIGPGAPDPEFYGISISHRWRRKPPASFSLVMVVYSGVLLACGADFSPQLLGQQTAD